MKVGGLGLRDHVRLLAPHFVLIAGVFALRLIVAAADSPAWIIRLVSVTTMTGFCILLAVALLHFRHSAGYANVVLSVFLINLWAQSLIMAAIVVSVWTGTPNVYTYPEYSYSGHDPAHTKHLLGHLSGGVGLVTLEGAAVGSLFLALLRRFLPVRRRPAGERTGLQ